MAKSNPEYSVISCRQENADGKEVKATGDFPKFWNLTGFQRSVASIFRKKSERARSAASVIFPDWVSGSVILIKRDLYNQTGGFFEGFWMYYEDVDLCRRIADAGGIIAFLNNVTIRHDHGGSSRINIRTIAITKTEVQISKHVYISRNFKGPGKTLIQAFLVINNLVSGTFMAIAGSVLFFVPKIFVRAIIFLRLSRYYSGSIIRRSWISPLSVLNKKLTL
jgi:GT2 family glycosyltransferase